jgi:ABC-type Fe3+-hydroxamate transport system substrate-binding protein
MRRAALLVFLAGLLLAASACGERSEPTGSTIKLFPVTAGGITLQRRPTRVTAVGPQAISLVKALEGSSGHIKLQTMNSLGVGQLRSFHPDLLVTSESPGNTTVPVYEVSATSIRDAESAIVDVGALLGRPLQARAMVRRIEADRRAVQRKVANLPPTTTFLDTGFFITLPAQSLPGDILSQAGGKSVAGANPGGSPFDTLLLHTKNPDFYLATSDSGISLKDLRRNPRTKTLRAVREGHFGIVPASYLQPGPDIGSGLVTIAKLLHPDAFR